MVTTSEPPAVIDVTPVLPVIVNVAIEDTQAFQIHLGLNSSLADPPLISSRAAGISRAPALVVKKLLLSPLKTRAFSGL